MKIFSALSLLLGILTVMAVSGGTAEAAKYRVLHTFRSANDDGYYPEGPLYRDTAGNIYGTTTSGGAGEPHTRCIRNDVDCRGTVFKITKDGVETLLHSFKGPADGRAPAYGLIGDHAGNLYGTTGYGGAGGGGTLFKITPEGDFSVLHAFKKDTTGYAPYFSLFGKNGNLYGIAATPNSANLALEVSTNGQVLFTHAFGTGADGSEADGNLVQDHAGNVYGTTIWGGIFCDGGPDYSGGTIFKIDTQNVETSFSFGCIRGNWPAGLAVDGSNNLYGFSHDPPCPFNPNENCGSVFKLSADGSYTVLHNFVSEGDGRAPSAPLVIGKDGNLYGFTLFGGTHDKGTIYRMSKKDGAVTILRSFTEETLPSDLMMDDKGRVYGISEFGGAYHKGFVFMLDPNVP